MKHNKCERLVALVLALAMCLSLMSTTAWAAEVSAEAETAAEEVQEDPETEEEAADDDEAAAEEEAADNEEVAAEEEAADDDEAAAEEEAADEGEVAVTASSTDTAATKTEIYINPEYADVITEDDLVQPSEDEDDLVQPSEDEGDTVVSAAAVEYCTTAEERAEKLREGMKNRETTIVIYYKSSSSTYPSSDISAAIEHTGDPEEGDYLAHQYAGASISYSRTYSGGSYRYTITYTMTYYTTAAQEAKVTARLDEVMDELDLDGKSDYQKIKAIYDYICDNVTYDYDHLNSSSYKLQYTAYGALIDGAAVCQGYAVLFYRMALEAGIDARYVSGTANNGSTTGAHGWNIVQLGNVYYNVDATWDAVYRQYNYYKYFLLGSSSFGTDHFRSSDYTSSSFTKAYPMSDSDYTGSSSLSGCTVTLSKTSYTYDGTAKKPSVTVKKGSATLTSGTDYTVSYSNNTNAGTATVTVTGKGSYSGTATATFTINKASQTVTASAASSTIYAGNTTTVTGKGKGTITYSSSDTSVATVTSAGKVTAKKPGTVTITVKAAATTNYKAASKTVSITVKLNKTTISSLTNTAKGVTVKWSKVTGASGYYIYRNGTKVKTITSGSTVSYTDTGAKTNGTKYQYKIYAYYGSTKSAVSATRTTYYVSAVSISSLKNSSSKKMTVKWGTNTKATGYQIEYSTSSSFSSYSTVTVSSASTVSKTISSLTKGKTYYVRVRAYKTVSGTKYYSAWSSSKNVKISK